MFLTWPIGNGSGMSDSNASAWVLPVLSLLGGAIGGVFGSFFAKRGEIAAIHGQLDKVVKQNELLATSTAEVNRKVSGKQRIWELKREAAYDALKLTVRINNSFAEILTMEVNDPRRADAIDRIGVAMESTWQLQAIFSLFFARDASELIDKIFAAGLKIISDAVSHSATDVERTHQIINFHELREALIAVLQEELNIASREL